MRHKIIQLSFFFFSIACISLLLGGCEDDKFEDLTDNRFQTDADKNSTIRIINLTYANQIIANGDSLTNFVLREPGPEENFYPGTKYFPKDGKLTKTWDIPIAVLSEPLTNLKLSSISYSGPNVDVAELNVDNKDRFMDHYITFGNVIAIPRSIEKPNNPANIKIRILNLSSSDVVSQYDNFENLNVPLSLVWSDGTKIDDRLSNVAPGKYSEYVDIPYGTYQLKVITNDNRQVAGADNSQQLAFDPATSTIALSKDETTNLTYAPIYSYKPGGIYTVVIAPRDFLYYMPSSTSGEQLDGFQNEFDIIQDAEGSVNATYARIQLINALPMDKKLGLKINGRSITEQLIDFGDCTDYTSVISGKSTIEVTDAGGSVLASVEYNLNPNENYSIWVNSLNEGVSLSIVSNDLAGVYFKGAIEDGTYTRKQREYFTKFRFLNMNKDFPYVTFTSDNGQPFKSVYSYDDKATNQLIPGYIPSVFPYVWMSEFLKAIYKIQVYRATASATPGIWANDVPVLTGRDLISNSELYFRGMPIQDAGVYTIALIGSQSGEQRYHSRLLIVKHTK